MFVDVRTKPCPRCGETVVVKMRRRQFEALRDHHEPIQQTLANFNADTRERFLSGYCPTCWDVIFPDDEEE